MSRAPVFLCYRQADGTATAARLYALLHGQPLPPEEGATGSPPKTLDVYFDQAAPGVGDWTTLHRPHLERAEALIVVCTPGAKLVEGEGDWVHAEIDWWLENRDTAPILVDPLGADERYVPTAIARRWPKAQRIRLVEKDWEGLEPGAVAELAERLRSRFLGAIAPSRANVYQQEVERERRRSARVRRAVWLAAGLGAGILVLLFVAGWIYTLKRQADRARVEADEQKVEAEAARGVAEQARSRAEAAQRQLDAARAQTEALLLERLARSIDSDAYRPVLEGWARDLQRAADELSETTRAELPDCAWTGGFTVYERQLVEVGLDEEGPESLFAYLAVVAGSSPRPGDWAPAVLDVFFAARNAVRPGRDRGRGEVKRQMKAVPADRQWRLLIGTGVPKLVGIGERSFRLTRSDLRMNDEGDMIMAFDVCREESATVAGVASGE